ncbi:MAG: hypothetical protein ABJO27_20150 [Pseudoruegeria sp.]
MGNTEKGDGVKFHGRGFVQLTGRANYTDWGNRLKIDLTSSHANADKALDMNVALMILFEGMMAGTFAGRKLSDFIVNVRQDWEGARQVVNGNDQAELIATYAEKYLDALSFQDLNSEPTTV